MNIEKQQIRKSSLDRFLTQEEQQGLAQFYDNEIMREAVKKVLLFELYHNGTLQKGEEPDMLMNFALGAVASQPNATDEQIASRLRATWQGMQLLEAGFGLIANYQTIQREKVVDKKIGI